MSTTVIDTQRAARTPAPSPHTAGSTTTLVLLAFAAVYVVWGSTYLAIRIGIESFPPLILAGLRHTIVGMLLYPILRSKTGIKPTAANWRTAFVTGALLLFVGNGGVSWAERTVPSGITALLVATVSLWLVIIDWLRPGGVKPVPRVFVGLLMGFAGLALLVGPARLGGSERVDPSGAVPGLAHRCRDHHAAHRRCCRDHPHRGHSGDHRAAPDAGACHRPGSSPWRSLIVMYFRRPCLRQFAETFRIDLLFVVRYF